MYVQLLWHKIIMIQVKDFLIIRTYMSIPCYGLGHGKSRMLEDHTNHVLFGCQVNQ